MSVTPPSPFMKFSHLLRSVQPSAVQTRREAAIAALEQESDNVFSTELASMQLGRGAGLSSNPTAKPFSLVNEAASGKLDFVPMGQHAAHLYRSSLTTYERTEILTYREVYYTGANATKTIPPGVTNNHGFDDDEKVYKFTPNDHIDYRYELLQKLGCGAFGTVYRAFDHKDRKSVALKILKNDEKSLGMGKTERDILMAMPSWQGAKVARLIELMRGFMFREHMVLVMELCVMDMYTLLMRRKKMGGTGFSMVTVRKFALGILRCLKFLSSNSLIHCDIKPENILLVAPNRTGIKVCDFNTSCLVNHTIYSYMQSRYYRAPEIILRITNQKYGLPIDMWSLGCVLVELLTGRIMFLGEDESDMMALFMEVLGKPHAELLRRCPTAEVLKYVQVTGVPVYTQRPKEVISAKGHGKRRVGLPGSVTLAEELELTGQKNETFIDFLQECFQWNPDHRLTPAQALLHPWFLNPPAGEHVVD